MTRQTKCNISAAMIFAVIGFVFYFAIDRKPPYEYLHGDVLPPDPAVGDQISIHWHLRVNRFCPGWVQREITDQRGYVWFNVGSPVKDIGAVKEGEETHIVNTLELPRQLGVGPATYRAHVSYRCNWLQNWIWPITVWTPTLNFKIVGHP